MDRRAFLKSGSIGVGGLLLSGGSMTALIREAIAAESGASTPWCFGVMADTQWSNKTSDPANPASCAINIISALNQRFIEHGAKFVVQVGDLVDSESWDCPASYTNDPFGNAGKKAIRTLPYRAWAAQALYDAGIGFFPLRGNHEASQKAASEIPALFPQTTGGGNNVGMLDRIVNSATPGLLGLSYAIDVDNVRLVLLDQFTRRDGTGGNANTNIVDQLAWIDQTLANRSTDTHAFVLAHKNLIGQNHTDCLFGADPGSNPASRNAFIASLQANRVGYALGGHDHMHHRSQVASPDGTARAEQIICASNSYKFYIPKTPKNDTAGRESVIASELFTIGYYLFTVDGPSVTVEFYSSSHGADYGDIDLLASPSSYQFYRRERFGYSLNGRQFAIAPNQSYTSVQDSYQGTVAKILDGGNADRPDDVDIYGRKEIKTVKTGWKAMPAGAASAVLKLWGLDNNLDLWNAALSGPLPNSDADYVTDTYVLSLSYDPTLVRPTQLGTGFCLAAKNADGRWVNAVDLNAGGSKKLVIGRWRAGYALGTYGIDPSTHTVWAVLNRDGEYVARIV
ncbi:metallophosphoesterase family protein [Rhodocyclus gracilis]|uniref:metallophosphoesterase family protein n=1 Tax=Rhodocyclus gracilis TaxID=2929842 RepID=UPI00188E5099|nr:metallophosphoesterase [Rhodocyclus gracilis]